MNSSIILENEEDTYLMIEVKLNLFSISYMHST